MKKKKKGFTLIELMIVIAIIIILTAIAVPYYSKIEASANRAKVISDFRTMRDSLEQYHSDWGIYPVTGSKAESFGFNTDFESITSAVAKELTGDNAVLNTPSHTDSLSEKGGIDYFTREWIVREMKNPFNWKRDYYYYSPNGSYFYLVCVYKYNGKTVYIESSDNFSYNDVYHKPDWLN